jgi:hypothetical protein
MAQTEVRKEVKEERCSTITTYRQAVSGSACQQGS